MWFAELRSHQQAKFLLYHKEKKAIFEKSHEARMETNYILVIEVGHPPRSPEQVESELTSALSKVRNSSTLRVIKVIHGYGSHGRGGSTKETVQNWAYRFRRHFCAVIAGENYDIFDADTQEMRRVCGQISDTDLGTGNSGITLLWVK